MNTTWDLSKIYNSNDAFYSDLEKAKKMLVNLEKFRGKLNNADDIIAYFLAESELSIIIEKLAVFSFCKKDDNGKDNDNVKNYAVADNFIAEVNEKLAFSKTELAALETDFLSGLKNDERFKDYDRVLEDIIRFKAHTLTEKEEQNIAQISAFNNTNDIFSVLSNLEMEHGSFIDENGKEVKLSPQNYNLCMNSPDARVRKDVMEAYYGEYGKLKQTYAGLLSSHIKYQNYLAKTYKFKSVLDMKCYGEEVEPEIMMVNIKNVSSHKDLLHRYFKVKKKILGLDEFYTSDISTAILNEDKKKVTYEEAVEGIRNSLVVLGEDYAQMFEEAVKNGWIDAYPRENKTSGGYTTGTYHEHPYILLNFDGTREWASALTHEFGHAMHSYYSAKNQPYPKYDYTLFVAEVVSLTNEILYNKYLISKAETREEKMKLLAEFLQLFELNVFDSSMLAEFELFIHEKHQEGESLTAEDYSNKFKQLAESYFGKGVKLCKNYEYGWCRKSHIYRDYYLYKYSMGLCCACTIASNLLEDKSGESLAKYRKFLTLGGSLDPISSLKVAGIDVKSSEIYEKAFAMFESYLNELEKLS
ncbi:MAG: oligoendopeptidase F family protein [Clostridia bacterium]|nr:oligoendopeptidase F family protein [Clostridia bacterium]